MAYNASLYNPYGQQQFQPAAYQQQSQPVNGLMILNGGIEEAESYWLPPGSVSQPMFLDEHHYLIKVFDENGGSNLEAYYTEKIPLSSLLSPDKVNVTKADFDAFKAEIMEAINNGKRVVPDVQQAAIQTQQPVPTTAS